MDDEITDDQRVLLDASARFVDDTYPLTRVRERAFDDGGFATDYRRRAGELGWYSLLVPEGLGGGRVSGNSVLDAALVAYTRGRTLPPAPFVGTNVVARALALAGTDEHREKVLPALMAGDSSAAWVVAAPPGRPQLDGPARAIAGSGTYMLTGHCTYVAAGDAHAWLLVTAATDGGPVQLLVPPETPGVRVVALDSLDLTRRYAEVHLDGVELPASSLVGTPGDADLVADQLAIACALTVAESVGAMDRDFEMTVAYAKDRIAFGRPIGSFQAVKHLLADMSLLLEMSKAVALAAARTLGTGDPYGPEAASMAKAFV